MKTLAYLRISTGAQELANQKYAILDYAQQQGIAIDEFVETQASTRQAIEKRGITEAIDRLGVGDRLIVSELSRLGRSLGQIIQIIDTLVKHNIRFVAIKEAIRFEGKQTIQTKVMIALFGLFAEVERDLISERTREGLAAAKAKGKLLGRPRGSLGQSKLDGKEIEIQTLLDKPESRRAQDPKRDIPVDPFALRSATAFGPRYAPLRDAGSSTSRLRHCPYDEWLDGVSDALAYGLRRLRDLRPLRHFGRTPGLYTYRGLPALAPLSMAGSESIQSIDRQDHGDIQNRPLQFHPYSRPSLNRVT